ncbi:MAG: hypothetical protein JSV90_06775 [Methanobacteriota archaeon]|nr:MAG: hypothetical protein JSV90_06775 [Euryarchaeota archaeon]
MSGGTLSAGDLAAIGEHTRRHGMTLALVRTSEAPQQLGSMLDAVSDACGLPLVRTIFSPLSDFGFAEFNSDGKMLVMLFIGGPGTELVSVSETDGASLQHLEDTVSSSNIQSSTIRDGL